MAAPIYHLQNLAYHYTEQSDPPALAVADLSISPASIIGLMGPNGSGKSTLLKLLAFVQEPTRGQVLYDGRPAAPFDDAVRFQVTLMPQTPYLMKRTVYDNVRYGLRIRKDRRDIQKRVHEVLDWVGLTPATFARRYWNELSGGEAQRVALASRLILRPRVLLLDEPIASVDAASAQRIKEATLRARQEWGATLVIASHDTRWLFAFCDEVYHLYNGRMFKSGMTNVIFGPWQPGSNGDYEKRLPNGERLVVPPPPRPDMAAVIGPDDLSLQPGRHPAGNAPTKLSGTITGLTREKAHRRTLAEVSVGDLSITVTLSPRMLETDRFLPGQAVVISYQPSRIRWV